MATPEIVKLILNSCSQQPTFYRIVAKLSNCSETKNRDGFAKMGISPQTSIKFTVLNLCLLKEASNQKFNCQKMSFSTFFPQFRRHFPRKRPLFFFTLKPVIRLWQVPSIGAAPPQIAPKPILKLS